MSLMRNNATGKYPSCSLLVFRTSPQNVGSEYIMLGDAVLNGLFAQFVYAGSETNPTNSMTLSLSNYALNTTYLGNKIIPEVEPFPEPTPTPEPDPIPEPTPDPTPDPTPSPV